MFFTDSQEPEMDDDPQPQQFFTDPQESVPVHCSQGHRSTLSLQTEEGGTICILCLSNLISNPQAPTIHVSYALSQLSIALSQPCFLSSILSSHRHYLVSPLVHALSSFDDDPIAHQLIDIITLLSGDGSSDICRDFVARVSDKISSGALAWSRRQVYMLHCFGVLLNCHIQNLYVHIKDKDSLVSNLVEGLQLPSEEIRGEILFVLYKVSILQYSCKDNEDVDVLLAYCPKLLHLSLQALIKTQNDDVRLNCVALLSILAQEGLFRNAYAYDISSMSSDEADNYMQTTEDENDEPPLTVLFSEAIKGPLLSTDIQVQISTLDLIFHYLLGESASAKQIQVLLEESISDYVFEILRLSECKDPVVSSCLRVLDIFSNSEQAFRQRLVVGFATLLPVLSYVADVPFHPAQSQTLNLIWNCVSDCPGVASTSHVEEIVIVLTKMLKRHYDGEMGLLPDAFTMACSTFVALLRAPSSNGISSLGRTLQEASKHAIVGCLNEKAPNQLVHSLNLLREAYAYSHGELSTNCSSSMELRDCIVDLCASHLLSWFSTSIKEIDEEITLGLLETYHFILLQDSDTQAKEFAKTLVSASWFSLSFGCLGFFSTERIKWRVYLMLSSLVDVLLGNNAGQPIRDAASCLPSDPLDMLFLLGQKSSNNLELSTCQSAVLLILHTSSLYNDRLADNKLILASLEQYVLVNSKVLGNDSLKMVQLVNIYGLYRGLAKTTSEIPCSTEVERIISHLLTENEWELQRAAIHPVSLKWWFQQEEISKVLSYQILREINSKEHDIIIHTENSQNTDKELIAELIAAGDNYCAKAFVFLLLHLLDEEGHEHDICLVLNLMTTVIDICPSASDHLCLHGIINGIQTIYYNSISSSHHIFLTTLPLIFNMLRYASYEMISDNESWVSVTKKFIDFLNYTVADHTWNAEGLLVIAILSLILHHSANKSLVEASRSVVFNSSLVSAINGLITTSISYGQTLVEHDEGTSMGESLIFVLLLYYFMLRSLNDVLPGTVDWRSFFAPSNIAEPLSMVNIPCHDLCRLMHFGPPTVKLAASYCLLVLLANLTEQINVKHEKLKCSASYLCSVMAVLEGLLLYDDVSVAMNSAHCLEIILSWQKLDILETSVVLKVDWCRLIVEEMAMSLVVPCLTSTNFINQHRSAIYVTVALLKLEKTPGWMRKILDDKCLSGIIENFATANVSTEMVLLFRELLNAEFLNAEQISRLNYTLQAYRKHMYADSTRFSSTNGNVRKIISSPDDVAEVREYLIQLMSTDLSLDSSSGGSQSENKRLVYEIEMFFRTLSVDDGS